VAQSIQHMEPRPHFAIRSRNQSRMALGREVRLFYALKTSDAPLSP